jgi:hypothetical protein
VPPVNVARRTGSVIRSTLHCSCGQVRQSALSEPLSDRRNEDAADEHATPFAFLRGRRHCFGGKRHRLPHALHFVERIRMGRVSGKNFGASIGRSALVGRNRRARARIARNVRRNMPLVRRFLSAT